MALTFELRRRETTVVSMLCDPHVRGVNRDLGKDDHGHRFIGHGGGSVGGRTVFRVYPEKRLVIALISNLSGQNFKSIPDQLVKLFWE